MHTFGLWSEYTKLKNRLFLGMVRWLQWNKIILIRKQKPVASGIGSLSFSTADPRVLQSGDVKHMAMFFHPLCRKCIIVHCGVVGGGGGGRRGDFFFFFFHRKM